jgi:hypothetical protein
LKEKFIRLVYFEECGLLFLPVCYLLVLFFFHSFASSQKKFPELMVEPFVASPSLMQTASAKVVIQNYNLLFAFDSKDALPFRTLKTKGLDSSGPYLLCA